jgi:hypothetical protein
VLKLAGKADAIDLTDLQRAALECTAPLVMVGAPPGGGKSFLAGAWVLHRSAFDTDRLHALVTPTIGAGVAGTLPAIARTCAAAEIELVYDVRPPSHWSATAPQMDWFRGVVSISTGLRIHHFSYYGDALRRARGYRFGSVFIDGADDLSEDQLRLLLDRCRDGGQVIVCRLTSVAGVVGVERP